MKETSNITEDPVAEVRQEVKKDLERKIVGSIRPEKNHILFKYNKVDGSLKRIEPEDDKTVHYNAGGKPTKANKTVKAEEGCIYVTAMNIQNAVKKLAKYHGLEVKLKSK